MPFPFAIILWHINNYQWPGLILLAAVTVYLATLIVALRYRGSKASETMLDLLLSVAIAVVLTFIIFAAFPHITRIPGGAQRGELYANLEAIQLELERFALDHNGHYPVRLGVLIEQGYLRQYPSNPYTHEPMHAISFGTDKFAGEFTYLPIAVEDEVTGYYLLVYGDEKTKVMDVDGDGVRDHVIRVCSSADIDPLVLSIVSVEGESDLAEAPARPPMPSLAEVLAGN